MNQKGTVIDMLSLPTVHRGEVPHWDEANHAACTCTSQRAACPRHEAMTYSANDAAHKVGLS